MRRTYRACRPVLLRRLAVHGSGLVISSVSSSVGHVGGRVLAVDEVRLAPDIGDGVRRRREGQGGGQDDVTRSDAPAVQREVQRSRARGQADGVRDLASCGHLLLERERSGPAGATQPDLMARTTWSISSSPTSGGDNRIGGASSADWLTG